jgi:hypothetical protein
MWFDVEPHNGSVATRARIMRARARRRDSVRNLTELMWCPTPGCGHSSAGTPGTRSDRRASVARSRFAACCVRRRWRGAERPQSERGTRAPRRCWHRRSVAQERSWQERSAVPGRARVARAPVTGRKRPRGRSAPRLCAGVGSASGKPTFPDVTARRGSRSAPPPGQSPNRSCAAGLQTASPPRRGCAPTRKAGGCCTPRTPSFWVGLCSTGRGPVS